MAAPRTRRATGCDGRFGVWDGRAAGRGWARFWRGGAARRGGIGGTGGGCGWVAGGGIWVGVKGERKGRGERAEE